MLTKIEPQDIERHAKWIVSAGGHSTGGELFEMTYDPKGRQTAFSIWDGTTVRSAREITLPGSRVAYPYSPENNLVRSHVVLFPSEASKYDTEESLVTEIRAFIHRYVDLTPFFESLSAYYVLLTWVHNAFNELPYLRLRGDFGSGKTRFLLIVGALSFRPIFASGASTISPLFRMLDAFKGTLIVDESDFRMSDEKAEFVKILNNGNARGFPVLRSEASGQSREFNPKAYHVFGPKIVAMRGSFADRALESRFITEDTGRRRLRSDIPITLPSAYRDEALHLRNKLLMFRFRTLQRMEPSDAFADRRLEPRLNQIFGPLLRLIPDEGLRQEILDLAGRYHRDIVADRGTAIEAQVLEIIRALLVGKATTKLSVGEITEAFAQRFGGEYLRPVTSRWLGSLLRRSLQFHPYKSHGVFLIDFGDKEHLGELFERYQIEPLPEPVAAG